MTNLTIPELAEDYKYEQKLKRNREYQREYYKIHKNKVLTRQKKVRDSKKESLDEDAIKKIEAERAAKRREYNRKYYLKNRQKKKVPTAEEDTEMLIERQQKRKEYQREWYRKNREKVLAKQKKKRADSHSEEDSENGEIRELKDRLDATKTLLSHNRRLEDKDKGMIKKLKKEVRRLKKQLKKLA